MTVDVALDGELPKGARPDLSVDGTIELERLDNVIYVGRPAFGQENNTVGIFKLAANGEAVRTPVNLGRSSVNTIEILTAWKQATRSFFPTPAPWMLTNASDLTDHDRPLVDTPNKFTTTDT